MMKITRFEDILAWQKAQNLAISIYKIFGESRDFGFRDQICRASVSVMNNISEGYERNTKKEFRRFRLIAKGSCGEVRSMLYLGYRLEYLEEDEFNQTFAQVLEISKNC